MFGLPVERWTAVDGDAERAVVRVVAVHGRRWAFVDVLDMPAAAAASVILAMRRRLLMSGEPIYALAQTDKHATSERLLRLLGFTGTDEAADGMRVWRCQRYRH